MTAITAQPGRVRATNLGAQPSPVMTWSGSSSPVITVTESHKQFSGVWRIADILNQCVPDGSLKKDIKC